MSIATAIVSIDLLHPRHLNISFESHLYEKSGVLQGKRSEVNFKKEWSDFIRIPHFLTDIQFDRLETFCGKHKQKKDYKW
jgi:hypothetical protein